jgi:hypothetical protein
MTLENVLNNNKKHPVNTAVCTFSFKFKESNLSYKMWYHHTVLITEGRDFALWQKQADTDFGRNLTTDLQQNNNWNVMTLENVLNNNKKHPVNTAVWHWRNASIIYGR